MSKLLSGSDLASYIKERHHRTSRTTTAKLAILLAGSDEATAVYVTAKERYGKDVGVEVVAKRCDSAKEMAGEIARLNHDDTVSGIVVQLPLPPEWESAKLLDEIKPTKDVDGLGKDAVFDPATPIGILWLLSGYNIEVKGKPVTVIGQGKLVGLPLVKLLESAGAIVTICDDTTKNLAAKTTGAAIIITAVGQPGLLTSEMVGLGAVVIDAGTAMHAGRIVGDADPSLYDRTDIKITPTPGGVGPMTVAALFDQLLRAAQAK